MFIGVIFSYLLRTCLQLFISEDQKDDQECHSCWDVQGTVLHLVNMDYRQKEIVRMNSGELPSFTSDFTCMSKCGRNFYVNNQNTLFHLDIMENEA